MENYDFYFIDRHGFISYIYGKEVVRTFNGAERHFIRAWDSKTEYPLHWAKKELSEGEKTTFVKQYNDMLKEDYEFQRAKHPEDEYVFTPMTFDEIVDYIQDSQKHRAK